MLYFIKLNEGDLMLIDRRLSYSVFLSLFLLGCGSTSEINTNNTDTVFTDTYFQTLLKFDKPSSDGITDTYTIKQLKADGCYVLPINEIYIELNSTEENTQMIQGKFSPSPCYTDMIKVIYDYSENNVPSYEKEMDVLNPQYDQTNVYYEKNNDPLFKYQWYLTDTPVNYNPLTKLNNINIDVENVWNEGITGKGVNIALVGGGIDMFHPDLKQNIDFNDSYNYATQLNNTTPWGQNSAKASQETGVAGIISAVADNGIGIKGIAYDSKIISYNVNDGNNTDPDYFLSAMIRNLNLSDVYLLKSENSSTIDPSKFEAQLKFGTISGRNGLGSVYIMGVGNDNTNTEFNKLLINNYIIPVGVIDNTGKKASYAGYGSNILVSGLSGEEMQDPVLDKDKIGVVTTDLAGNERGSDISDEINPEYSHFNVQGNENYDYTDKSWGSDDAAAMVGGVVSLMLEANPNLTSREIKLILAKSANTQGLNVNWTVNAQGYKYNREVGFGLVDAFKAVEMAKYAAPLPPQQQLSYNLNPNTVSDNGVLNYQFYVDKNVSIEDVVAHLTFDNATTPYKTDVYNNSGTGNGSYTYKLYAGENNMTVRYNSNTSTISVNVYDSNNNLVDTMNFDTTGTTKSFTVPSTGTYTLNLTVNDTNQTVAQNLAWSYEIVTPHPNAKFSALNISLVSPAGTPCVLMTSEDDYNGTLDNEGFMCYPFLGENSQGYWTLKVSSADGGEFKVDNLNLDITGH
jgi:hypothetical protein